MKEKKLAHEFMCKFLFFEPATIQWQVSLFCFFLHNFLFNLKLCMMVDSYVLYPVIVLDNFLCTN